jgi:hypothetical protein
MYVVVVLDFNILRMSVLFCVRIVASLCPFMCAASLAVCLTLILTLSLGVLWDIRRTVRT